MGVDCKILLPGNVAVDNVIKVIGAASGCKVTRQTSGSTWWAKVVDVRTEGVDGLPEITKIQILRRCVDGVENHHVLYHFEVGGMESGKLLAPRSTAFWLAVGHRLVDFFGGSIDHNDCDDQEVDYAVPHKTWRENSPTSNEDWVCFQNRILAITPITEEEWRSYDQFAAHKIDR